MSVKEQKNGRGGVGCSSMEMEGGLTCMRGKAHEMTWWWRRMWQPGGGGGGGVANQRGVGGKQRDGDGGEGRSSNDRGWRMTRQW